MNVNEGTESLAKLEAECAEGRTAPRVSLDDIKAAIEGGYYVTGAEVAKATDSDPNYKSLSVLTICLIIMKNGFTVIGKAAPASPENFDETLGRKLAFNDAVNQIWPLMGFALRERLHKELN